MPALHVSMQRANSEGRGGGGEDLVLGQNVIGAPPLYRSIPLAAVARLWGVPLGDDPQQLAFEIRVRAAKHEADMFYVNGCMRLIEDQHFG